MKKAIFKIGRAIYMGIMIAISLVISFKCLTIPAIYYVAEITTGQEAFNLSIIIGLFSIVLSGMLFYTITTAVYSVLIYLQLLCTNGHKIALRVTTNHIKHIIRQI